MGVEGKSFRNSTFTIQFLMITTHTCPQIIAILAVSADGKIADFRHSPARFGSKTDKAHLETQIAAADAVIFGANTLRAYGTTLTVTQPQLLEQRTQQGQTPQPVHIVITRKANLNPEIRFFQQPIERWLITTANNALFWQHRSEFNRILTFPLLSDEFDLSSIINHLANLGIRRLAVLGGSELVASFLNANLIDEIYLTICPLILGGKTAPSLVSGQGFLESTAPQLELLSTKVVENEVFLHYRVRRP
ncbi:bifunctional deaminase-reductase-like protein [Calothrix sp. NIES-3974]|nr:bifunctional deaminase-reductase-like protein [Calothrix sp. NIES-3974]